jgi:hypothetical protein
MSYLSRIQTSSPNMGSRVVVVGAEKMGKTTLAAGAPDALLIPFEQGYGGVKVPYMPLVTEYASMLAIQNEIAAACTAKTFKFRTLVIDSATALETLIHRHTIALDPAMRTNKAASMEIAHGGYGKAYGVANTVFKDFLGWCDWLAINHAINIVFTAHAFAAKVKDPLAGEYDSWDVLLHSPKDQKTYGKREIMTQWADVVGYLHEPMTVMKGDGVNKGTSMGQGRVFGVERQPSYTAGNRYGMRGTIALPAPPANAWNYFADALFKASGIDLFNRAQA